MLPLKKHRTPDGHLCGPLPETGFADYKVTPSRELDFSGPGLHLGSFILSADSVQGIVTGREDAFLDLSWDSGEGGFQVGVSFRAPYGDFSIDKHFVTRLGRCREQRDRAGITESIEAALRKLHSDGFVRLFVTMDPCTELVSNWKARQKAESFLAYIERVKGVEGVVLREDLIEQAAGQAPVRLSVPLQESAEKKVFNLHVCLTQKAFEFDADIANNTGLAKHAHAFGRSRTGGKALADVTEALLKHGGGLELGPDSDGLLNQTPGGADNRGDSETLPADLPSMLDSIALPNNAPEAECPGGLLTEPKRYQLQGLAWMMAREGAEKRGPEGPEWCRETGGGSSVFDESDRSLTAKKSSTEKGMVETSANRFRMEEDEDRKEGSVSKAMALSTEVGTEEVEARGGATNGTQTAGAGLMAGADVSLSTGPDSVREEGLGTRTEEAGQSGSQLHKETGAVVLRNELFLHPCWQQLLTADGQVMYMQREGGTCSPDFYLAPGQGTCGGLLCDEMVSRSRVPIWERMLVVPFLSSFLRWCISKVGSDRCSSIQTLVIYCVGRGGLTFCQEGRFC